MKRMQDKDLSPSGKRYRSPPPRREHYHRDRSPDRDSREGRGSNKHSSNRDYPEKMQPHRDYNYDDRSRKRYKEDRNPHERYPPPPSADRGEFRSICVSGFPSQVQDQEVKEAVFYQFKKFGEFSIKVTYNQHIDKRLCYVNFRYAEDAKAAKEHRGKLFMFDRPMRVDAVYPNLNKPQKTQYRPRSISPPEVHRDRERMRDSDSYSNRSGSPGGRRSGRNDSIGSDSRDRGDNRRTETPRFPYHLNHVMPEDDDKATRTLFVGNLDPDVGLSELREIFGRYGHVEDIDIKLPPGRAGNPFAFVRYHNLDMAHKAKVEMSGKFIGKLPCKIGYGKVHPTTCLWVGGIGPWIHRETLEREFDRFGVIHKIDWPQGKNYAFVLYDNTEAASAACQEMRGFPLGGPDRRLRVDFADSNQMDVEQPPSVSPLRVPPPQQQQLQPPSGGPGGDPDDFGEAARVARGEIPAKFPKKWHDSDRPRTQEWQKPNFRERDPNAYRNQNNFSDSNRFQRRDNYQPPPNEGRGEEEHFKRRSRSPADKSRFDNGRDSPFAKRPRNSNSNHDGQSERGENEQDGLGIVEGVDTIVEFSKCLPSVWNGAFVLKNSSFSARLYVVSGDINIVESMMRDTSTDSPCLRITQRLRLDQTKLDEVSKRVSSSGATGHCVLLAMSGATITSDDPNMQQRPLRNLVTYLKQKEAAGVVTLPIVSENKNTNSGVLHAFPPCEFGHTYLSRRAPKLTFDPTKDDHMLVLAVKGAM